MPRLFLLALLALAIYGCSEPQKKPAVGPKLVTQKPSATVKPAPPVATPVIREWRHPDTGLTREQMRSEGLSADVNYPFWPLVYDDPVGLGFGTMYGKVFNFSNISIKRARIQIALYDATGAKVGDAFDTISSIDPRGTWKFQAHFFCEHPRSYKVANLTGDF